MFYKVLFILAIIKFVRDINRYLKEYKSSVSKTAEAMCGDIPIKLYLRIGASAMFYIMVISVAAMPRLFWW